MWCWYWFCYVIGAAMMGAALPDDGHNLAELPPPRPRPPQRHVLDAARIVLADPSTARHEQHEKTCRNCGVVRVTVIGGVLARLWRLPDGSLRLTEPACEAVDVSKVPA